MLIKFSVTFTWDHWEMLVHVLQLLFTVLFPLSFSLPLLPSFFSLYFPICETLDVYLLLNSWSVSSHIIINMIYRSTHIVAYDMVSVSKHRVKTYTYLSLLIKRLIISRIIQNTVVIVFLKVQAYPIHAKRWTHIANLNN